jgi:cyclohexanecarboxylate-CoA ligase
MADRVAVGLHAWAWAATTWWRCSCPTGGSSRVLYLACSRIGAVLNPLMHIFRERELSFMLKHGEAKVLVVPKLLPRLRPRAMARNSLQPSLPAPAAHRRRRATAADDFDALLSGTGLGEEPDAADILTRHRPGPTTSRS